MIIKLLMKIFSGLFDKLVDNWDLTRALNTLLGSLIGLVKGVLIVSLILAGLSLIPMEWLTEFFDNTLILKVLFHENPINKILAMFLVG
ncbi:MAG: CvpA family protein [Clostridia bacterium]|nr:CvpA family protein [Clostridia bacterium]